LPGFTICGKGSGPDNTVEPKFTYRYNILILGPIQRDALLFAKDLTLPTFSAERQEIIGGSLIYKYAKNIKWEDVNISFYDVAKPSISNELDEWKDLVATSEAGLQKHSDYKKDCVFEELNGLGKKLRTIKLKGAWPASIAYGKLSYTDSSIKIVELTLSYDYATFE
jgi:hypothetical protein